MASGRAAGAPTEDAQRPREAKRGGAGVALGGAGVDLGGAGVDLGGIGGGSDGEALGWTWEGLGAALMGRLRCQNRQDVLLINPIYPAILLR